MTLTDIVRKAVTPIRLGWQGGIPLTIGLGLAVQSCAYYGMALQGQENTIFSGISWTVASLTWTGLGGIAYASSLSAYSKMKKNIERYGDLDKNSVEKYGRFYCTRQGGITAAANAGLRKEFDEIIKNYKGPMKLKWLPNL